MSLSSDINPAADELSPTTPSAAPPLTRGGALAHVLLCSGFPTQIVLTQILLGLGMLPFDARGQLTTAYVTTLTLVDSVMLIALIFWLLARHHERPADVFIGARSVAREAALGVLLVPIAGALVIAVLSGLRALVPWLHNVPRNPLEALIQNPADAVLLGVVAVIGGGLREELQRAFILHRFRQRLGGPTVGLIVFSSAFGAGHLVQGMDVAVTTAVLGFFWGTVYLRRGSIIAPVVCHAGFNAAEIVRHVVFG
ncbi:MAG: CPBP family intramembrane metalloprotease [Acidobacteria bacterium]|nr:CPBP family intramembrane metalloprotease [Acidobacteriota bacterium]